MLGTEGSWPCVHMGSSEFQLEESSPRKGDKLAVVPYTAACRVFRFVLCSTGPLSNCKESPLGESEQEL